MMTGFIINKKNFRIEIRTIRPINDEPYNIYDLMKKDAVGDWHSVQTYEDINDAIKRHPDIVIVDNSDLKGVL